MAMPICSVSRSTGQRASSPSSRNALRSPLAGRRARRLGRGVPTIGLEAYSGLFTALTGTAQPPRRRTHHGRDMSDRWFRQARPTSAYRCGFRRRSVAQSRKEPWGGRQPRCSACSRWGLSWSASTSLFFRPHSWERLMVDVGIVLVSGRSISGSCSISERNHRKAHPAQCLEPATAWQSTRRAA
jgi:hypothetical protein